MLGGTVKVNSTLGEALPFAFVFPAQLQATPKTVRTHKTGYPSIFS